jgi:hypothetical protein
MHSLCLVAFQLLHHDRLVGQMQPSIGSLPKFEERALNGFLHLLRLSTGAPEDDDPSVFTQLLAQRLGVLLQLLVAGVKSFTTHVQLFTGCGK